MNIIPGRYCRAWEEECGVCAVAVPGNEGLPRGHQCGQDLCTPGLDPNRF